MSLFDPFSAAWVATGVFLYAVYCAVLVYYLSRKMTVIIRSGGEARIRKCGTTRELLVIVAAGPFGMIPLLAYWLTIGMASKRYANRRDNAPRREGL